jgi:surface protein
MFQLAETFNQPLNSWNVSIVDNMYAMFNAAEAFNQPLNNWNVSSVTNMESMFYGTYVIFNQNIGSWDVSSVTNLYQFLAFATPLTFSTTNLDAIYNGWSALPSLQNNVTASFGTAKYTSAAAAGRNTLVTTYNWKITDGGQV